MSLQKILLVRLNMLLCDSDEQEVNNDVTTITMKLC